MAKDPLPKHQPKHHLPPEDSMAKGSSPNNQRRAICTCLTIFLLLAGITVLVLWLVYRPYKPRFTVVGAAIYGLNATGPPLMSTTMQFTILIRNPNRRVSIYYDKLSAFVSYKNQAITPQVVLPPLYLEKHSTVSLSLVIGGSLVPVSLEVTNGLAMERLVEVAPVPVADSYGGVAADSTCNNVTFERSHQRNLRDGA